MRDGLRRARRVIPTSPPVPDRVSHLADHSPLDLGSADRSAGVRSGLACHDHLGIQTRGLCGRIELHQELRSLVLLDVEARRAAGTADHRKRHPTGEPVRWGGEAAAERAVIVAPRLLAGDLLPVRVVEDHGHRPVRHGFVAVFRLIHADADALVLDRLAGTIERTVGEEDRLLIRRGGGSGRSHQVRVRAGESVALVFGHDQEGRPLSAFACEAEHAVGVGPRLLRGLVCQSRVVVFPSTDFRAGNRLAVVRIEHESLDVAFPVEIPNDQRQVAHPDGCDADLVVLSLERRIVAGDDEIVAFREPLRRGHRFRSQPVVVGGGQFRAPLNRRRSGQQFASLRVGQTPPGGPGDVLLGDRTEVDLRHVAVRNLDRRQRIVPDPLRGDDGVSALDVLDEIVAQDAAHAGGIGLPAAIGQSAGLHVLLPPIEHLGPGVERPGGDLVVLPLVDESLQGRDVQVRFLRPDRVVVAERQAKQVRVEKRGLVGIVLMKAQQGLVQPDRLEPGGL